MVEVVKAVKYNSWPMIQALGGKLVCAYSRGSAHSIVEPERGIYAKVSSDGGLTWSDETQIANDPRWAEVTIGKGLDNDGAMLLWVRCWSMERKYRHHDLYRTEDGVSFEKIATPELDPVPMQITDIFRVPGVGMMSFWFSDGYAVSSDRSWGILTSADNGRTWAQRTVERGLGFDDWPTEPSGVYLGDGRIFAVARSEEGRRYQFALISEDFGKTWRKSRTNISDVDRSTPSLIYDAATGLLSNYYYQRGARKLKRRVVSAEFIFAHPDTWPEPEVLFEGNEPRDIDAGNVNAVVLGERHFAATYSGTPSDTAVIVLAVCS